jgi:ATP-dependent DNA ligase
VAIDESGRPSFSHLQNFSANANAITFYAFDILMWKGKDQRMQPLDKRRDLLRTKAMPKLPAIFLRELSGRRRKDDLSRQVAGA